MSTPSARTCVLHLGCVRGSAAALTATPAANAECGSWPRSHERSHVEWRLWAAAALAWLSAALPAPGQAVVINEIMYHPASEDARAEYVELFNPAATNVNVGGWRFSRGVQFTFPTATVIPAGGYLVVAAHKVNFLARYPGVTNVIGDWIQSRLASYPDRQITNWVNVLSNRRNTVRLDDASGEQVDSVTYADEGDWAIRARGPNDLGHYGWVWTSEADGFGRSLELMNPGLPNDSGQNWAPSPDVDGTPGRPNGAASTNIAPLILEARHFPVVPTSSDQPTVSARVLDEQTNGLSVTLHYRLDSATPPPFSSTAMLDDGAHGDGVAGDGLFGVVLPALPNGSIVEFYIEAQDGRGNSRTWPAAARQTNGLFAQTANALFQVDDTVYTGPAPLYKIILTTNEYVELGQIFSSTPFSDAQMNATFISLDGTSLESRYLCGVRNRGHGSRSGNPHNYRVNFRSDEPWKGASALNLNARTVYAQHFGAVLAQKAGVAGNNSRAVQLRVNNGPGPSTVPQYGHFAANEVLNSDWAERHLPLDDGGNIYRAVRDLIPGTTNPDFTYRGENPDAPNSYKTLYVKETNASEDDWRDLAGMLAVMGTNNIIPFAADEVRQVINAEQWLLHLAVMSLFGNNESGLNTGNNDDYFMYRGREDPRFILMYHDLDQILGQGGSLATNADIFRATCCPISGDSRGVAAAFNRFMHWADFEPIYYATLQRLIATTFSAAEFDPLIDQTLGSYVPANVISAMKTWMAGRRASVQSQIAGRVPATPPVATVAGEPRSPTPLTSATLVVGGAGVTHYRYLLNNGGYGPEVPVSTPIQISGRPNGSTNWVYVMGRNAAGTWQTMPTRSRTWVVNTAWPAVRLNEVLTRNNTALNHHGTYPDLVELFNEGASAVDLSDMRLTDDAADPNKFVFPRGVVLEPGSNLVLYANNPDGTPGLHLGFALSAEGEGLYLFHRVASGGALLDRVEFGLQLPDLSIGRVQGGTWVLTQPTFGAPNVPAPTGDPRSLRINEWLTAGQIPHPDDAIELFNTNALPVPLGGLGLTDTPIGAPRRHVIAPLSFMAGGGYQVFKADGNTNAGADHVGFQLASEQGEIALLDANLSPLDWIVYGPQRTGVSEGRCPDGASCFTALSLPTLGTVNLCSLPPPPPQMVNILPVTHVWSYDTNGVEPGPTWKARDFDDSAWGAGPGLLGWPRNDPPLLPEPLLTRLTPPAGKISFYFRTRFTVASNLTFTSLQISNVIDDGAVFYLNGNEIARYNMPSGPVFSNTLASTGILDTTWDRPTPATFSVTNLAPGDNVMAAEVHQSTSGSADYIFGLRLDGLVVTNLPSGTNALINEVLANNASGREPDGSTPDWVELYNPSSTPVDLADASLSDSTANPRRWVFPVGSVLPGQGYLRVRFDSGAPASATNTGFGLKATGDSVYLFNRPAAGGGLLSFVTFGLQAADFSIARLPDGSSNWALAYPSPESVNLPATLGEPAGLRINEWMAAPGSGEDWFEVLNPSPLPVAVGGFHLSDSLNEPLKHTLPPLSFIGGVTNGYQRFWAVGSGNVTAPDEVGFKLSASGDEIGLYTPTGTPVNEVSFGAQASGVSQGRFPDGAGTVLSFPTSVSPGEPNYLPLTNQFISEVLSHSDLPLEDAIELHNTAASPVNIGGWFLSDSKGDLRKYRIPDGTILPAFGFKVFYEYQFNNPDQTAAFALSSAKGDEVYLSFADANGVLSGHRAGAKFGPAANGVSFGRHQTSVGADFTAMSRLTFGTAVQPGDPTNQITVFRTGQGASNAYPLVGPVIISEIMYHPPPLVVGGVTNDNVRDEFIELRNLSASFAPLYDPAYPTNGWRLRDGVDFRFNSGHSIPPGGHLLVVSFDPLTDATSLAAFRAKYGSNSVLVGPYSGKLDNGGESIELVRPDAPQLLGSEAGLVPYILVEKVVYDDRAPWPVNTDGTGFSLQRLQATGYGNDPTNWFGAAPTPGPSGIADTDGDGMPDWWEDLHGFNKNSAADAQQDADGDGFTNLQEYLSGTDPRNPDSLLHVSALALAGGVGFIEFTAVAGHTYSVLYRDSLSPGGWTKLADVPAPAVTGPVMITDDTLGPDGQRYYQVVTPKIP